jgi:hypothetical protein
MEEVQSFKVSHSSGDAYFFAYDEPLCIYFGKKPKFENAVFVRGKKKAADALIKAGMLELDRNYAEKKLQELEMATLSNAGIPESEVNKMQKKNPFEYYHWVRKKVKLPEEWFKLREILDGASAGSEIDSGFKLRFYKPKKDEILSELMDRLR